MKRTEKNGNDPKNGKKNVKNIKELEKTRKNAKEDLFKESCI